MDFTRQQKDDAVKFICDEIEHVIKDFGDRDPGNDGERKALDYMKSQIAEYGDDSYSESFKVAPHAFFGWTYFVGIFMILGIMTYFFAPIVSVVCVIFALVPMVGQFVLYRETIDWLFKKRESGNVWGGIKPKGELKRRIVLNGHSDATYEWHWHYVGGYNLFLTSIIIPIIGVVYLLACVVIACISMKGVIGTPEGAPLYMGIASVIFVPFYIAFFLFSDIRRPVPGANDNLTACYMAISVLKLMKENDVRLENTEVVALVTGSEEAGLRGAKFFCRNNPDLWQEKDVETVFVTYETLRELEHLVIYNKDLNGTVKLNMPACEMIKRAAAKNGMELHYGSVYAGATDAAAFAQAGRKSACIAAMAPQVKEYYHTRLDNYDNLSPECLSKVLDITVDFITEFDEKGLAE